ncbi:hypothetical protein ACF07V_27270 [Streptomyces sp. NPDC015661]|uniref:hypothetical protein n=1 Tax=Streptomyces sp. NPDC015661 TaxID=3364961 RepID=UPI0036FAD8D4
MKLKRKLATVALAGGLALTGVAATAPSAAANEGNCPSGRACFHENIGYYDRDVETGTTKTCIDLRKYGETKFAVGIGSYVNYLPVKVDVYHRNGYYGALVYDGTIRPGGFSSNSSNGGWWGEYGTICTGGATP